MVLKSLELHGFKSFPDKTKLSFDKGITAVVGPNGSGKSNISDAIRWVLGEQSSKTLRGSKMEDVIFDGTNNRKAQGYAEVCLTFDNKSRRMPYDDDEVSISRRYYRSGESDYQINKVAVRLKDIHELFMDTGLGRDGYSMIGQGKIADVVSSKSEDRRQIFEEAAGISRFRYRKHEAEKRLNQTEDNLSRLRDILSVLEERVGPLEEQAKKAKKYLEYAGEKKTLEISVWLHSLSEITNTMRDLEYKITLIVSQSEQVDTDLEAIEAEFEELQKKARDYTLQIDEIRNESARNDEEAAVLEGEIKVLFNDISHNLTSIERIQGELDESERSKQSLAEETGQKKQAVEGLQGEISAQNTALTECTQALEGLSGQAAGYSEKIEELSREYNAVSANLADKRVEAVTAESSIGEIKNRGNTIDSLLTEKEESAKETEQELNACKADLDRMEEEIDTISNTVKGYEYKATQKKEKLAQQKEQADKLLLDAGEKERRHKLLVDLERNLEGFGHSVKAVLKNAERGLLRGIHGPVSRIITVKKEYAVAIEIALGAAMQNVVVGTEQDAKQAIAQLKKEDGGRATFLPISSVKGRTLEERGLEDCDGFVGLAVNLVSFDSQYEQIAASLLGRVAVAEDLDYAVSIAKKFGYRFRIVTLDGQVVNSGGSLTGGSLAKSSGLLSRAGEIERIKEQAEALRQKAEFAAQVYKQMEEEYAGIEASLLGAKGELSTLNEDKIRLMGEIRHLEATAAQAKQELENLLNEKNNAQKRLTELENTVAQANTDITVFTISMTGIQGQIDELSGGRDSLSKKREELNETVSALRLEIVALERDMNAISQSIEEITARSFTVEERKADLRSQIESLEQVNTEITEKTEAMKQTAENLRKLSAQTDERIAQVNGLREGVEQSVSALRVREREKQGEREKLSVEHGRLEERKNNVHNEYDTIQKQLWEEYSLTKIEADAIAVDIEDLPAAKRRLNELKNKIKNLGHVNVEAIEEYKEVSEQYEFLKIQIADVENAKEELLKLISELTQQMKSIFTQRFKQINEHFGQIFTELFGGGQAYLEISDKEDILNSGIDIKASPPGKIIKNLEALSGGEKALIAISLYFAIMKVSPSPFCVLDEIEAALDDVNVDRFAAYLRRMSNDTQFIAITHRRGTMEEADVLYGVTMQDEGVSKLLELRANEAMEKLGLKQD